MPNRRLLILAALFAATAHAAGVAQGEAGTSRAETPLDVPTAPVVLDGRALFPLRGITSYPAERRAAAVRERIRELADTASFDPASLRVVDLPLESRIVAGERLVLRLFDVDAEPEGVERHTLAELYAHRIREAVASYRAARTGEAIAGTALRVGLATALAALMILGLGRLFALVDRRLARRLERERGVTVRSFEIIRADRLRESARGALRLVKALGILAVAFFYAEYILARLPWTRGAAAQLREWVLAPLALLGQGLLETLPDLVFLVVFFLIVRWVLGLIRLFFAAVGRGEVALGDFEAEWAEPTYKIVRLAVMAFALVVAYPYIPGSSSNAFKGISVFLGVLLSLGSSSAVSNMIAGYTMIYRRAFREGDVVRIGSVVGVVGRTRLQVTHLRTPKNEEVVIPNASIVAGEIVNYSTLAKGPGLILHTTVGIGYQTPWRQVEAMLLEAAARTPGLVAESKPFILQIALAEFAVTYQLNVYCDDPKSMPRLYSELHRQILDVFNEYGVQIMTPAYEGDPSEPKIVPRERWHLAPAEEKSPGLERDMRTPSNA